MIKPQIRTWRGWVVFAFALVLLVGGGLALAALAASEGVSPSEASAQADKLGFTKHGDIRPKGGLLQTMPVTFGQKDCVGTLIIGSHDYAKLEAQVPSGVTIKTVIVDNPTLDSLRRDSTFQGCFS